MFSCGSARKPASTPYTSEYVCSTVKATDPPAVLKRLMIDRSLGMFDALWLDATWFYDAPIEVEAVREALVALVTRFPVLAGRRTTSDGIALNNAGMRFSFDETHLGSAHVHSGVYQHTEPGRGELVDIPYTAAGGLEPLLTVRVTNFNDGTSALGVAMPHVLTDGKSFFIVVSALSTAVVDGHADNVPDIDFDCAKIVEAAMPTVERGPTGTQAYARCHARALARLHSVPACPCPCPCVMCMLPCPCVHACVSSAVSPACSPP